MEKEDYEPVFLREGFQLKVKTFKGNSEIEKIMKKRKEMLIEPRTRENSAISRESELLLLKFKLQYPLKRALQISEEVFPFGTS